MTIKSVLIRFFLTYITLNLAAGIVMIYFEPRISIVGINLGILIGCIIWICGTFCKKTDRYFTNKEKIIVILGFFTIDFLWLLLPTLIAPKANGTTIIGMTIVSVFHAIVIFSFVSLAKKFVIKHDVVSG